MHAALDDRFIRSLVPPERGRLEAWDTKTPGLVLRVTAAGARTFSVRYRVGGRGGQERRLTLGEYRAAGLRGAGVTLAEARDQAQRVIARWRLGGDPQAERKAELARAAAAESETVEALTLACLRALPLRPKTAKEWARLARVELIAKWGKRPAAELRRAEIRAWLDEIKRRPAPYTANRAFEVLRRVYSWALEQELLEASPFVGLRRPAEEQESERVLSTAEVRAVWRALIEIEDARPTWAPFVDAVRLLFLTGMRRDMVVGGLRAEIEDLDGLAPRWTIAGERTKNGRPHVAPLSAPAVAIVRRRLAASSSPYLFPVQRSGRHHKPGTAPMPWASDFVAELRARAEAQLGGAMPRWTIHNIRHTVGTHMREDLRVPRDVVALILAHSQGGAAATRIYDRAEKLQDRRAALVAWATWIEGVASDDPAAGQLIAFPVGA